MSKGNKKVVDDLPQCKKRALPSNFYEEVCELELEAEKPEISIKSVNKLLELYMVK